MAKGIQSDAVKQEFLEHAREEQDHADRIAERIVQLGGNPEMNPAGLATRSHSEYQEGDDLVEMIEEDLIAERIAIESYREMVRYFEKNDPTSRRLMEKILAKEEEHAEDLSSLLQCDGRKIRQRLNRGISRLSVSTRLLSTAARVATKSPAIMGPRNTPMKPNI